jgi:hypothetical protein
MKLKSHKNLSPTSKLPKMHRKMLDEKSNPVIDIFLQVRDFKNITNLDVLEW